MVGTDEKIEKIKKVAYEFFLEIGYEATTIRMICKAAGIESPTLYYFFKSKKGLFLDIRNDWKEEYRNKVRELFLENEESPEKSLKRYFAFCVDYAINNPDKTRFYLRYRLFKPAELKDEIEDYIKESIEEKRLLYGKYLEACVASQEIDDTIDGAFRKYINFIDNNAFNIIFSHWKPEEEEIDKAWNIFYNNYMKK